MGATLSVSRSRIFRICFGFRDSRFEFSAGYFPTGGVFDALHPQSPPQFFPAARLRRNRTTKNARAAATITPTATWSRTGFINGIRATGPLDRR
jgi:hypothetical protein